MRRTLLSAEMAKRSASFTRGPRAAGAIRSPRRIARAPKRRRMVNRANHVPRGSQGKDAPAAMMTVWWRPGGS